MRATTDRARLDAAVDVAKVDADATRYGPALKLAESILSRSQARRKEAVLISDFQRAGWTGSEDVHFGEGYTLTPVSVASPRGEQHRDPVDHLRARVVLGPGARHGRPPASPTRAAMPVSDVPVTLEVEGHQIQTQQAKVGANATASVSFTQFTVDRPIVKGTVRAGTDPLPADNVFHFTVSPAAPVSLLLVTNPDAQRFGPVPLAGARHQHDARLPHGRRAGHARDAGELREAARS